MERLDKVIATGCGVSRADARRLILRAKVTVGGKTVRDIAHKVDPAVDEIYLNGQAVCYQKYCYLMMHKPAGVLTATEDKRQKTVLDLVPPELHRRGLYPVGRLDRDTTGLLLLTNDGDFGHMLLSPNKKIPKQYLVGLDDVVSPHLIERFAAGLTLADGTKLSAAGLQICEDPHMALVTITEGKYHQIKRMFGLFSLGVVSLKRISFAGLTLPEDLPEGQVRPLTASELDCIYHSKKSVF